MIETIDFGGKKPVFYGLSSLYKLEKLQKRSITEILSGINNPDFTLIVDLIYVGLQDGARKEGKDFSLTQEDICDVLDENFSVTEKFIELFSESMPDEKNLEAPQQTGQ